MRAASKLILGLAVVFVALVVARAEDKEGKKVTLKGEIACAKCVLKLVKGKCVTAITVKDGDKDVVYFFDDSGNKETYHKPVCTEAKKGSVTGVVTEKDGKKYIKPDKDSVKYDD